MDTTIISKIYNSRKTLCEQLDKRGYNTDQYKNDGIHEIMTLFKNKQMDMLVEHSKDNKKCYVKYSIDKSLKQSIIVETIAELYQNDSILSSKDDEIIFIVKDEPTDTLKKVIEDLYTKNGIFISVYNIHRLLYNILEHAMVPEHIVLSEEEKEMVFEKYNIAKPSQVAEISRFDPVSIAIGLRPNQLCKIIRKSKTAIESEYYRICVNV